MFLGTGDTDFYQYGSRFIDDQIQLDLSSAGNTYGNDTQQFGAAWAQALSNRYLGWTAGAVQLSDARAVMSDPRLAVAIPVATTWVFAVLHFVYASAIVGVGVSCLLLGGGGGGGGGGAREGGAGGADVGVARVGLSDTAVLVRELVVRSSLGGSGGGALGGGGESALGTRASGVDGSELEPERWRRTGGGRSVSVGGESVGGASVGGASVGESERLLFDDGGGGAEEDGDVRVVLEKRRDGALGMAFRRAGLGVL